MITLLGAGEHEQKYWLLFFPLKKLKTLRQTIIVLFFEGFGLLVFFLSPSWKKILRWNFITFFSIEKNESPSS